MPDDSEDMYGDGAPIKAPENKEAEETADQEHKESDEGGNEFPLPKEVLEGKEFEVGDEVVLRITAMHDDQIFVSYAPAKDGKEKAPGKMDKSSEEGGEVEHEMHAPSDMADHYG